MTLASPIGQPSRSAQIEAYLVFVVAGMEMAVALRRVSEIIRYEKVAVVPAAPPYIRGVVHVRGRVLPVVDLAIKLGKTPEATTKRTSILVLDVELEGLVVPLGIVADQVSTLIDVDRTLIQPPPRFGVGVEVACLEGLYGAATGTIPLIDVLRVFSHEELLRAALEEQRDRIKADSSVQAARPEPARAVPALTAEIEPAPTRKVEIELWDDEPDPPAKVEMELWEDA